MSEQRDDVKILEAKVRRLTETLGTLISWIYGAANSPLSLNEAKQLHRMLEGADDE